MSDRLPSLTKRRSVAHFAVLATISPQSGNKTSAGSEKQIIDTANRRKQSITAQCFMRTAGLPLITISKDIRTPRFVTVSHIHSLI
jgi:hypothetical protein